MVLLRTQPAYERLGVGYQRFRQPDRRIATLLNAALGEAARVVNVGAGTGSYEPADRSVVAVEPSPSMIRQRGRASAPCLRGDALRLPLADRSFDAALAVLTVHHWSDQERGLRELGRVANGVVILTFDPLVHNDFWLFRDYVPAATQLSSTSDVLGVDRVAEIVAADRVVPVPIPHDCRDGFGSAYWRRPHSYLDPGVRQCISCLAMLEPSEIDPGIERLRRDLENGEWHRRYRELLGRDSFDGGIRLVVRDSQ